MINYQESKQEIINEILKDRKTTVISKKMGFNFDKVARWQNGSKQLRWDEFCDLCKHTNAPLINSLNEMGFYAKRPSDALLIVKYLKNRFPLLSIKEFAELSHSSLSSMNRFIRGESYPDLEFILKLIDFENERLSIFTNSLVGRKDEKILSMMKYPWMPAVANTMILKEFQALPEYSSSWIATYLGIPAFQVDLAVTEFLKLGIIQKNGAHYERTPTSPNQKVVTIAGIPLREEINGLIGYWTKFIQKKMSANANTDAEIKRETDSNNDRCLWRIFTCGPKNTLKVNEILARAEQEIHELLAQNPEEPTDVRVMLLHHFSASVRNSSE